MKQNYILIVDDDKDFRDFIVDYLEEQGFSTRQAENGETAIKHIMSEKPDLILLDIQLPTITGLDVCRILKARSSTSDIPVIFVTGNHTPSNMLSSYLAGAGRYLSKPFMLSELKESVHHALRHHDIGEDRLTASSNARGWQM